MLCKYCENGIFAEILELSVVQPAFGVGMGEGKKLVGNTLTSEGNN